MFVNILCSLWVLMKYLSFAGRATSIRWSIGPQTRLSCQREIHAVADPEDQARGSPPRLWRFQGIIRSRCDGFLPWSWIDLAWRIVAYLGHVRCAAQIRCAAQRRRGPHLSLT